MTLLGRYGLRCDLGMGIGRRFVCCTTGARLTVIVRCRTLFAIDFLAGSQQIKSLLQRQLVIVGALRLRFLVPTLRCGGRCDICRFRVDRLLPLLHHSLRLGVVRFGVCGFVVDVAQGGKRIGQHVDLHVQFRRVGVDGFRSGTRFESLAVFAT